MKMNFRSVLERMPALSPATQKLLTYLQGDNINANEVENLLISDAVIVSRMIQIANSSFYGLSRQITSIHDAFVILGAPTVKSLVYTLAVIGQFSEKKLSDLPNQARLIKSVWLHSLYSACLVRSLADLHRTQSVDQLFIASLFQHMGLIILIYCEPEIILPIVHQEQSSQTDIMTLIEQKSGQNYCSLSARALEAWHFPSDVCRLINPTPDLSKGKQLMQLGNCLADAQGITLLPNLYFPVPARESMALLPSDNMRFNNMMTQTDDMFFTMRQGMLD